MQRILFYGLDDNEQTLKKAILCLEAEIVPVVNIKDAAKHLLSSDYNMVMVDSSVVESGDISVAEMLSKFTAVPIIFVSLMAMGGEHMPFSSTAHTHHPHHGEHHPTRIGHHHILSFRDELVIDPNRRMVMINGDDISATKKEFDLLYCLAKHRGRVLTCEQLYNNLWLYDTSYNVDDLIKTHIKRLRKKMGASTHSYIENVRGVGYCFRD